MPTGDSTTGPLPLIGGAATAAGAGAERFGAAEPCPLCVASALGEARGSGAQCTCEWGGTYTKEDHDRRQQEVPRGRGAPFGDQRGGSVTAVRLETLGRSWPPWAF